MNFRFPKINGIALSASVCQADAKNAGFGFKGKARPKAVWQADGLLNVLHGLLVHPRQVTKNIQVPVAVEQQTILEGGNDKIRGKNRFFIKTPQQAVTADAVLLIGQQLIIRQ